MTRGATEDTEAYQLYLQGRYHWNKRTLDDLEQSIDYFQQAIQKDPRYALAYAGQADAYALIADFNVLPAKEVMPKVKLAALRRWNSIPRWPRLTRPWRGPTSMTGIGPAPRVNSSKPWS